MLDQFTINNEPLENAARVIQAWDGARGIGPRRQTNIVIPNRDGELWLPKAREAKVFTVGMTILGCDPQTGTVPKSRTDERARFNQNWQDFVRLISDDTKPLTLGRTMVYPGGRLERQTARGEIDGEVMPDMIDMSNARVAVSFKLLDGVWFGEPSDTLDKLSPTGSGLGSDVARMALESPGDSTTWQIQVIMSGANGPQRLTNDTTGDWVEFTGDTTQSPVTLDIPTFSATQNDVSVIKTVRAGDRQVSPYWMTLRPGPNQLEVTGGGTIQVKYRGAHL